MTQDVMFVSVEDAVKLHAFVLSLDEEHAAANVRDKGLLESALNRPKHLYFYEEAEIPALAATLLWGVVTNHAFYDGNKRTGWAVTQFFLSRNGLILRSGEGSVRLVLGIAMNRRNLDQVEEWIRHNLEPLPRSS